MAWDKIIIGAGLYGLYAARYCGRLGQQVLVLEWLFRRPTSSFKKPPTTPRQPKHRAAEHLDSQPNQ